MTEEKRNEKTEKTKSTVTLHPRTGHEDLEGAEGYQRYSFALLLTSALNRGGQSTPGSGHFTHAKDPVPIGQEVQWAPGPF